MKALVTGLTGQIGSFLAEHLLDNNIEVYGLIRRSSTNHLERISHILNRIYLVPGDLADQTSLDTAMREVRPDFIFNCAAQSFVHVSWTQPEHTANITGLGVLRMLEAMRKYAPEARFVQSSSSEIFGRVQEIPQKETTPFYPRSPYGIAKLLGYWMVRNARESYGLFASNAIKFNQESSRRGHEFVTRKISLGVAAIKLGLANELRLGNLDAKRDWGFAGDAARAMLMIAQHSEPDDFVVATGQTYSIRDFLSMAFGYVGLDYLHYVKVDESLIRPAEVDLLIGDYSKIQRVLGWMPGKRLIDIVHEMVECDLMLLRKEMKQ